MKGVQGVIVAGFAVFVLFAGCDQSAPEDVTDVCEAAAVHAEECTGTSGVILPDNCNEGDAALLLGMSCEVFLNASSEVMSRKADDGTYGGLPLACVWFGIGCPVDDSCNHTLSEEARAALIALSEPMTLQNEYDAQYRIEQIARIFEQEPDPIGMFAIVYRHITNNAVQSVEDGMYEHPKWTRKLITAFAWRYLVSLHGYLTDGWMSPQWSRYYAISRDCSVGRGHTLGIAIATHLLVDLAYALRDVETIAKHKDDYMLFGEVSLWVFPNLVEDISTVYETDVSGLLKGFFFGEWVDALTEEGKTTNFIYQTVRVNSWRNSQNMWSFPQWMVDADIASVWRMAEGSLATLDAMGAL